MKTPTQTTLPGIRDWREPQIVSAQRLASMITEANAAGFDAIRMECIRNPLGYRVTFQRMQDASEGRGARPVQNLAQVPDGVLPNRSKESL
jgi:hypothetical protein